jgi:hypothetical protein
MKAALRYLHSPDLADLENAAPPDPEKFCLLVQAMVGPAGDDEGEESFDFLLCTPTWLAGDLAAQKYIWGRHYLIVPRYDFATLQAAVQQICAQAEGSDWDAVAAVLSRYGKWEFEDYSG